MTGSSDPTRLMALLAALVMAGARLAMPQLSDGGGTSETKFVDPSVSDGAFFGGGAAVLETGGNGVAMDGDVIVVTAMWDDVPGTPFTGSASVYRWSGTAWVKEASLVSSAAEFADFFGSSVAIDGDVIVVGVPGAGTPPTGTAIVFRHTTFGWVEEATLVDSLGTAGDGFGWSVAVSGDVIAVGAAEADLGGPGAGAATSFRWDGRHWLEEARLTGAGGAFGNAIAADQDTVVVGAPFENVAGAEEQGTARVYRWDGASWVEVAVLTPAAGAADDRHGTSVSISGDVIVSGSPYDKVGAAGGMGSATVYRWDGATWVEETTLISPIGNSNDNFGLSVSVRDDLIAVGSPFDNPVPGDWSRGSAMSFRRQGDAWAAASLLLARDGQAGDRYGLSVAASGEHIVVGAPFNGPFEEGAAYVYDLSTWADLGGGTGGSAGTPHLVGFGTLVGGSPVTLRLTQAPPAAPLLAWISFSSTPFTAIGGTVHAFPFASQLLFLANAGGAFVAGTAWPTGVPAGTATWFQFVVADPSTVFGLTLSNAVRATSP